MPTKIGRYLVERKVGSGGMGVVYAARDPELDRLVAIKVLNPDKTDDTWGSEGAARLLREAQAMAQLSDPNVIQVYDFGRVGHGVFIAMKFVEGTTLRQWLDVDRPVVEILDVFAKAGRGLEAAHAAGLVHRDFKPDNVLIGDDGRIRVADFGLARPTAGATPSQSLSASGRRLSDSALGVSDDSLTRVGAVMGTPSYMAPEQHRGAEADARADQYAYCVALFRALYGAAPFRGKDVSALARAKQRGEIDWRAPAQPVPLRVQRVLRRGLRPKPEDRFASMAALLTELSGRGRTGYTRWIGLALAGGIGALGWVSMQSPAASEPECDRGAKAWAQQRRDDVNKTLREAKVPDALAVATRTLGKLDAYAQRWEHAWAATCDVAQREPVRRCLRDHQARFDLIAQRLADPESPSARRATRLVNRLTPVEACTSDTDRGAAPQPPDELAQSVEAIRAKVELATSYELAGQPKKGLEVIDVAVAEARELGFVPTIAESIYRQGRLRRTLGEGEKALECFVEATTLAEANRYDHVVANSAIEAMVTLGLTLDRKDEALEWARRAESAVERVGTGSLEDARRRHHEGIVRARAGDYDTAKTLMTDALALRRRLQGDGHLDVANTLLDLGALLGEMEQHESAYAIGLEALAIWEEAAGPKNQYVAFAHMNVGSDLMSLSRLDEALPHMRTAHEVLVEVLGEDHPSTLSAFNNLGTLHQRAGRLDEALEIAQAVLRLRQKRFGDEHRSVARAHGNLAVVLVKMDRTEEARPHAEQTIRTLEQVLGPEHPQLVTPHKVLAEILTELGQPREALAHNDKALELARTSFGDDNFQVGRMFASRAATRLALGAHDGASADARQALTRFGDDTQHATRAAETHLVLAQALAGGGDLSEAKAQAQRGLDRLGDSDSDAATRARAQIDAWLQAQA